MNKDGFVSSYFLVLFLYVISLSAIIAVNDQNRIRAMMNLKESSLWFAQESSVISDLKCRLRKDMLEEEDTVVCADGTEYRMEISGNRIYAAILSDLPEQIEAEADLENRYLLSCSYLRQNISDPD